MGIFAATIAFGGGVPNQPNFKQAAPSYGGPSQYSKATYAKPENREDYSVSKIFKYTYHSSFLRNQSINKKKYKWIYLGILSIRRTTSLNGP